MEHYAKQLIAWYHDYGRHDLPWQINPAPYRVWVSEIMLQQTQVATVIPYYLQFMRSFPSVTALANAELDHVLQHWSGLGYYSRARNLHKSAQLIQQTFNGALPDTLAELIDLPGIGESTAGAILSFGFKQHAVILDGNVKRVLTRLFCIDGWPGLTRVNKQLWQIARQLTPSVDAHHYNQAIMDIGATVCTRTKPKCSVCPFTDDCLANQQQAQHLYPTKKPKKAVKPEKSVYMLLLVSQDHKVLLYKRPTYGIWGGLWSLPEIDSADRLEQILAEDYGVTLTNQQVHNRFTHRFSHYDLHITPIVCYVQISQQNTIQQTEAQLWHQLNDTPPGGIPKPVQQLLTMMINQDSLVV